MWYWGSVQKMAITKSFPAGRKKNHRNLSWVTNYTLNSMDKVNIKTT